jgi:hypothetical protein
MIPDVSSCSGRGQKKMNGVAKPVAGSCPKISSGVSNSGVVSLAAMLLESVGLGILVKDFHGGCGVFVFFFLRQGDVLMAHRE